VPQTGLEEAYDRQPRTPSREMISAYGAPVCLKE
jgi:hypothetical protein